jgi:hypothetical protein
MPDLLFIKDCGEFRVGAELADKTAREINGYHLSRGHHHYAANRAGAMSSFFDGDDFHIETTPESYAERSA